MKKKIIMFILVMSVYLPIVSAQLPSAGIAENYNLLVKNLEPPTSAGAFYELEMKWFTDTTVSIKGELDVFLASQKDPANIFLLDKPLLDNVAKFSGILLPKSKGATKTARQLYEKERLSLLKKNFSIAAEQKQKADMETILTLVLNYLYQSNLLSQSSIKSYKKFFIESRDIYEKVLLDYCKSTACTEVDLNKLFIYFTKYEANISKARNIIQYLYANEIKYLSGNQYKTVTVANALKAYLCMLYVYNHDSNPEKEKSNEWIVAGFTQLTKVKTTDIYTQSTLSGNAEKNLKKYIAYKYKKYV